MVVPWWLLVGSSLAPWWRFGSGGSLVAHWWLIGGRLCGRLGGTCLVHWWLFGGSSVAHGYLLGSSWVVASVASWWLLGGSKLSLDFL